MSALTIKAFEIVVEQFRSMLFVFVLVDVTEIFGLKEAVYSSTNVDLDFFS